MNPPDRFPEHVGNGQHLQLLEHPILRNRNAVGDHHLLKQALR